MQPPANLMPRVISPHKRSLCTSRPCYHFHFDTHHFVQRLEREGLNRAQAEGIMTALAEVIDESIRNMASNMVTKADQEKVRILLCSCATALFDQGTSERMPCTPACLHTASLHTTGRLCSVEIRAAAHGEERARDDQG